MFSPKQVFPSKETSIILIAAVMALFAARISGAPDYAYWLIMAGAAVTIIGLPTAKRIAKAAVIASMRVALPYVVRYLPLNTVVTEAANANGMKASGFVRQGELGDLKLDNLLAALAQNGDVPGSMPVVLRMFQFLGIDPAEALAEAKQRAETAKLTKEAAEARIVQIETERQAAIQRANAKAQSQTEEQQELGKSAEQEASLLAPLAALADNGVQEFGQIG